MKSHIIGICNKFSRSMDIFEKYLSTTLFVTLQTFIYILADPCGINKYKTWSLAANTYFSYVKGQLNSE